MKVRLKYDMVYKHTTLKKDSEYEADKHGTTGYNLYVENPYPWTYVDEVRIVKFYIHRDDVEVVND